MMMKKYVKTLAAVAVAALLGAGLYLSAEATPAPPEPGKIVFFEMEIHKGKAGAQDSLVLANTLVRNGWLKKEPAAADELTENLLKCTFLDQNMEVVKATTLDHPLRANRMLEYPGADHSRMRTTSRQPDKASFVLRTRFDRRIKYLQFDALAKNGDREAHTAGLSELIEVNLDDKNLEGADARIQLFDVVKVKDNGPDAGKIVFAVLAEGYQASELNTFMTDVNNWMAGQFNESPYDTYESDFNVYAVKAISNVSGAAMDPNNLIDNYFGSTYWYAGIERLLVPTNTSRLTSCLADHVPNYDQALVIVNHSKYGGSGGWVATASTHADGDEILFHEVGHSFAGLADEYWAGSQYAAEKPNMTADNNPATIRWKDHLYIENIGIYQHTGYSWYRPHQSCLMRYLGYPFCRVCRYHTIDVIQSLTGGGGTPTYCSSTHSDCYQHIERVRLGSIDNSTSCSSGYSDYTAQSTTMQKGVGQTLRINVFYYGWTGNKVYAWIDWNRDGDFDDSGEQVYGYTGSANPYQTTVTPPTGAAVGQTVMRVSCFYYDTPSPCGAFGYGETEDYTINITN